MPSTRMLKVTTPGRICLFGEHQDYLGLPVIACAISLRISVEGERSPGHMVVIDLPDIGSREEFDISGILTYAHKRDYLKSALNVLRRNGFSFSSGITCRVRGTIPINSGTSSSSALLVSWVGFLARMSDQQKDLDAVTTARLAHQAEVLEFGEPGGMMDHYTTAIGGTLFLSFVPEVGVVRLHPPLETFVLGDSGEPKDTTAILARTKFRVLEIASRLERLESGFSLAAEQSPSIQRLRPHLSEDEWMLVAGTVKNHEITHEALQLMQSAPFDHIRFGVLLTEHQTVLREILRISTPKIDRMLAAAISAGAYGGKINGSGGGGCMFAYAPEDPGKVAKAVEAEGGKAYIIERGSGTTVETPTTP
jgi:galactokinase